MRLRGHKPGCKCVGCSPATRKRGMAALRRGKKRIVRRVTRMIHTLEKSLGRKPTRFRRNPLTRKALLKLRRRQQRATHKAARDAARGWDRVAVFSSPSLAAQQASDLNRRDADKGREWKAVGDSLFFRVRRGNNPLTRKGRRIRRAMCRTYGKRKGSRVFYASARSGRIRGVERKRRTVPNLPRFIGSNITLYTASGRKVTVKGSRLYGTENARALIAFGPPHKLPFGRSGSAIPWPVGGRVVRIDYDNPGKAQRAYGRVARFRHDFRHGPRVEEVGMRGGKAYAKIVSTVPLWRTNL